jgi:hypothetical protein
MRLLPLGLAVLIMSGCRTGDPLQFWRNSVEQYAQTRGNGDLSALQSAGQTGASDDPRPALAMIIARDVRTSPLNGLAARDVHGLLLGVSQADGGPWYVFAVGVCDPARFDAVEPSNRDRVVDVRIAAVSGQAASPRWRIGPPDEAQLVRYCRAAPASLPTYDIRLGFPRITDDFVLTETDDGAEVVERGSGATWRLPLIGEERVAK